jgi:hypothetical protein
LSALAAGRAAVVLDDGQLGVLARMLGDALERRTPPGDCPDCELAREISRIGETDEILPAELCEACADDLAMSDEYVALAAVFGIDTETES